MPFQTPKNTLGWTLPAEQDTTQTIKPTKAKAKPPRNLRVKKTAARSQADGYARQSWRSLETGVGRVMRPALKQQRSAMDPPWTSQQVLIL